MRSFRSVRGAVGLALLTSSLVACGGASIPPSDATAPSGPASVAPGAGNDPSTGTQPSVDPGTGTTASNPPIEGGAFLGGAFHAEVTGVVTTTLDYPLIGGQTIATAGATIFTFGDATGAAVAVGITDAGNTVSITSPQVSVAGGNIGSDANRCTIEVVTSDASRVAGTFECADLVAVYDNLTKNGNVNLTGTFEATR